MNHIKRIIITGAAALTIAASTLGCGMFESNTEQLNDIQASLDRNENELHEVRREMIDTVDNTAYILHGQMELASRKGIAVCESSKWELAAAEGAETAHDYAIAAYNAAASVADCANYDRATAVQTEALIAYIEAAQPKRGTAGPWDIEEQSVDEYLDMLRARVDNRLDLARNADILVPELLDDADLNWMKAHGTRYPGRPG